VSNPAGRRLLPHLRAELENETKRCASSCSFLGISKKGKRERDSRRLVTYIPSDPWQPERESHSCLDSVCPPWTHEKNRRDKSSLDPKGSNRQRSCEKKRKGVRPLPSPSVRYKRKGKSCRSPITTQSRHLREKGKKVNIVRRTLQPIHIAVEGGRDGYLFRDYPDVREEKKWERSHRYALLPFKPERNQD